MGRSVFEALGNSRDAAEQVRDAFDAMDRKTMIEVAEHYDPDIPLHENEAYMAKVRELREGWQADLESQIETILGQQDIKTEA